PRCGAMAGSVGGERESVYFQGRVTHGTTADTCSTGQRCKPSCSSEGWPGGRHDGVRLASVPSPRTLGGRGGGAPAPPPPPRARGFDPPNFDHHLTLAGFTQSTVSFVYSKLVRHKVGGDVPPGTFFIEPDLAERWEALDDTTYVFYLRQGVKWHNKPPVNGR